jgi:hypothetical protein
MDRRFERSPSFSLEIRCSPSFHLPQHHPRAPSLPSQIKHLRGNVFLVQTNSIDALGANAGAEKKTKKQGKIRRSKIVVYLFPIPKGRELNKTCFLT